MVGGSLENKEGHNFYLVDFEEIHWLEESGECTNYGEEAAFKTFADCVATEQEQIFKPILGCQVPWLAAPGHSNICKGRIPLTKENYTLHLHMVNSLMENTREMRIVDQFKTCLKPCQELRSRFTLKHSKRQEDRFRRTVLSFQKRVKVTKYLNAYGFFDLMVEAGSSLGLWIGLSALGLFDLLLQVGNVVRKKVWKIRARSKHGFRV